MTVKNAVVTRKSKRLGIDRKRSMEAYIFLIPWLIGVCLFFAYPIFVSIRLAFSDIVEFKGLKTAWVGLENFNKLFAFGKAGFGSTFLTVLAWTLVILGWFMAVYYSNSYNGKVVRALFGYTAGESSAMLSVLSWLFWAVLYGWVPFAVIRLVDDSNPDKLIAVGAAILIAGIAADNVNLWLKQVASRPRYKYLITLEDPKSEFRNWWQMIPNLAGSNDNFKSWPSGNMTIASMMFSLPMLTDVMKKRSGRKNGIAFALACVFVLLYGYNRIHMTNHFLSDVCFGTLITYLIYSLISTAFLRGYSHL